MSLSQSDWIIKCNAKPALSVTANTWVEAGVSTVGAALYGIRWQTARLDHTKTCQWHSSHDSDVSLSASGTSLERASDQKIRHCWRSWVRDVEQKGETVKPSLVVLLGVIIPICWGKIDEWVDKWMMEEEIPLSGWNWMASSGMDRGRTGGTWCRGCCQGQDSGIFVFSIITPRYVPTFCATIVPLVIPPATLA